MKRGKQKLKQVEQPIVEAASEVMATRKVVKLKSSVDFKTIL